MLKDEKYYKQLLLGFISNSITPAEVEELYAFIRQEPETTTILMDEPDILLRIERQLSDREFVIPAVVEQRLQDRLKQAAEQISTPDLPEISLPRQRSVNWRWAAAAALLAVLLTASLLLIQRPAKQTAPNVATTTIPNVPPGRNGAVLTLSSGQKVVLDSMRNGLIAKQNGAGVHLKDGQVSYNKEQSASNLVTYNTISTPNGRKYQIALADGTQVWLNAASSITFPTAFEGRDRAVTISGEAYFEVAKNTAQPFRVAVPDGTIEVLGTSFNISAYKDEEYTRTTLLEGAVRVTKGTDQHVLKPGQQAQFNTISTSITIRQEVDTEGVIAWKDGMFDFRNQDLATIMRQIGRWYNMEIVYEGEIPAIHILSRMNRNTDLNSILHGLELIGLRFKTEGGTPDGQPGKITVLPEKPR